MRHPGSMTQQVEALGPKSDDFSSVLRAHTVRGKNQLPQVALCPPRWILDTHAHTHTEPWSYPPASMPPVLKFAGVSHHPLRLFAAAVDMAWLHSSQRHKMRNCIQKRAHTVPQAEAGRELTQGLGSCLAGHSKLSACLERHGSKPRPVRH